MTASAKHRPTSRPATPDAVPQFLVPGRLVSHGRWLAQFLIGTNQRPGAAGRPDQRGHYDGEGAWTLELPFSSPRELVMDILRYGPEVEVVEPPFLRDAVAESARRAAEIYS
ncbi:MAG: WYL domain-containing protein [Xanthomonadales bacterium]|nr:WYL domain-containing protein [Xanthomonadales bacterium]